MVLSKAERSAASKRSAEVRYQLRKAREAKAKEAMQKEILEGLASNYGVGPLAESFAAASDKPDVGVNEPNVRLPKAWGELPEKAKLEDEVEWVHQNRSLVVGVRGNGMIRFDWFLAKSKPPSNGAIGIMMDAGNDPKWFKDLLVKVKRAGDEKDDDPEKIKEDVVQEREIEEMLGRIAEAAAGRGAGA